MDDLGLGQRIRATRRRKRWTQEDLIHRLDAKGLTRSLSWLSRLETGKGRQLSMHEFSTIADALEVGRDYLEYGDENKAAALQERLSRYPKLAAPVAEIASFYDTATAQQRKTAEVLLANLHRSLIQLM